MSPTEASSKVAKSQQKRTPILSLFTSAKRSKAQQNPSTHGTSATAQGDSTKSPLEHTQSVSSQSTRTSSLYQSFPPMEPSISSSATSTFSRSSSSSRNSWVKSSNPDLDAVAPAPVRTAESRYYIPKRAKAGFMTTATPLVDRIQE